MAPDRKWEGWAGPDRGRPHPGEEPFGSALEFEPEGIDFGVDLIHHGNGMKTCTISEAKQNLGRLADAALSGEPTVIARGGKLVILRAYESSDGEEFDSLIEAGKQGGHRKLTPRVFSQIWKRGRALSRK